MTRPVILRPLAQVDIQEIRTDQEAVRPGLGDQFAARLKHLLERIEALPELYAVVWQDVRAARVRKFRYVVYFRVLDDRVEVLAVIHGSRDPSTWQSRA